MKANVKNNSPAAINMKAHGFGLGCDKHQMTQTRNHAAAAHIESVALSFVVAMSVSMLNLPKTKRGEKSHSPLLHPVFMRRHDTYLRKANNCWVGNVGFVGLNAMMLLQISLTRIPCITAASKNVSYTSPETTS